MKLWTPSDEVCAVRPTSVHSSCSAFDTASAVQYESASTVRSSVKNGSSLRIEKEQQFQPSS